MSEYSIIVDIEKDDVENTLQAIASAVHDEWVLSSRTATRFKITYEVEAIGGKDE